MNRLIREFSRCTLCISFSCPVSQKTTVKTTILEHGGEGGGGAGFHICDRFHICNRFTFVTVWGPSNVKNGYKCEKNYKYGKNHRDCV